MEQDKMTRDESQCNADPGVLRMLTDEISRLRDAMDAGFASMGSKLDQRKEDLSSHRLQCGAHRGEFEQRIARLEDARKATRARERLQKLDDAKIRAETVLRVAILLGGTGASAMVWKIIEAVAK